MRRFAYGLLVLIWIAGIWIWSHPAPDAVPAPPLEPGAQALAAPDAAVAKLDAAAAPRRIPSARVRRPLAAGAAAPAPALVRVRSSVGLPLLSVEVSISGGEWEPLDLPGSGLEVMPDEYPLRVRAAGHVGVDVPPDARELVLEPDALLTVESPNLRTRAQRLAVLERSGRSNAQNGILAEFPDAHRLLVAFSPARLAPIQAGDVDVSFVCADGRPVSFALRPLAGLRAHYVLAPDDLRGLAPLEVEIVDEGERPQYMRLWLSDLGPPRPGALRTDFAWGSVSIGEPVVPAFPDPLWGRAGHARVEALALGRSYALCAIDANEHYGRIEFVHDGSARRIVLQLPYTVVGRAIDAGNSSALVHPDVRGFPLGRPADPDWFARGGRSDFVGGFELHLPGSSWGRGDGRQPLEAPERFTIVVSAEGHRSREVEIEWAGRRRVDVGALALAPNPLPIAVDMTGLVAWLEPGAFTFGDEPALEWTLRYAVARGDGIQELELAYGGSESTVLCRDLLSGQRTEFPFAPRNGELLLLRSSDEAFAFRRDEGRIYQLLPRTSHQVAVLCERLPEGGSWTLGWRGGGTWAAFRTVNKTGSAAEWLLLPQIATELWWSAGEAPPELCKRAGGVLALEKGEQSVVLR